MPSIFWILLAALLAYVFLSRFESIRAWFYGQIAAWEIQRAERREREQLLAAARAQLRKAAEGYATRMVLAARFSIQFSNQDLEIVKSREKDGAICVYVSEREGLFSRSSNPPVLTVWITLLENPQLVISFSENQRWVRGTINEETSREAVAQIDRRITGYSPTRVRNPRQTLLPQYPAHQR